MSTGRRFSNGDATKSEKLETSHKPFVHGFLWQMNFMRANRERVAFCSPCCGMNRMSAKKWYRGERAGAKVPRRQRRRIALSLARRTALRHGAWISSSSGTSCTWTSALACTYGPSRSLCSQAASIRFGGPTRQCAPRWRSSARFSWQMMPRSKTQTHAALFRACAPPH